MHYRVNSWVTGRAGANQLTIAILRGTHAKTTILAALLFAGGAGGLAAQVPAQLDRIVVTAPEQRCPVADQSEAHALWKAMAAHYAPALSQLPRDAWIQRDGGWAHGSVLAEDLGSFAFPTKSRGSCISPSS